MTHQYKLYTGPTLVQAVAEKLRCADGVIVTLEGTQHVFVTADAADTVLDSLIPMEGWSLRDIAEVGGSR